VANADRWLEAVHDDRLETEQDIVNFESRLAAQMQYLLDHVAGGPPVSEGAIARHQELLARWTTLQSERDRLLDVALPDLNRAYAASGLPAVVAPPPRAADAVSPPR